VSYQTIVGNTSLTCQERDSFVLVLIDGDGLIFEDSLLQAGEQGGKEAAGLLWSAVRDHVHRNIQNIPADYKIVARIYAHLKGLGATCYNAGIVDNVATIENFSRGFGSKQLFDFVDVGSGKDRADEKISGIYAFSACFRADKTSFITT
jgi:hypothetical protein